MSKPWLDDLMVKAKYEEYGLPPHMLPGLEGHVENGRPTGDFLSALLENNLRLTVGLADERNQAKILQWVRFCHNWLPAGCWGSSRAVAEWREDGGRVGRAEMEIKRRVQLAADRAKASEETKGGHYEPTEIA